MSHYSEEEQIESLKAFWEDYGNAILSLLLIASVAFAGWRYWQVHQRKIEEEGAMHFQQVMMDYEQDQAGDTAHNTTLQSDAHKLIASQPNSGYANLARWMLARKAVDHGDLNEAAKQLNEVLTHTPDADVAALTHLRLAQVLLAQGQTDAALKQAQATTDPAYRASSLELQGDAWVQAKNMDKAHAAYQAARDALVAAKLPPRPLLNMKMADLGIKPQDVPAQGVPAS